MREANTFLPATKMPRLKISDPLLIKHPTKQLFEELLLHQKAGTSNRHPITTIGSFRSRPVSGPWRETTEVTVIPTFVNDGRLCFTVADELYEHLKRPLSRDFIHPIIVHAWVKSKDNLAKLCFGTLFEECKKYVQLLFVVVEKEQTKMFRKHLNELCQGYETTNVFILELPGTVNGNKTNKNTKRSKM